MENVDSVKILELATKYANSGEKWHFHILTPECKLNTQGKYSLVLENGTTEAVSVCYSDKPFMDIGKELVQLLHGKDVIKTKDEKKVALPSEEVKKMLGRAEELIKEGIFWHHHMLFPYCKFNNHKGSWVIVFEDAQNNKIIESISTNEPKNDLQYIENLFYSQKK